jgi:hypothetical protein
VSRRQPDESRHNQRELICYREASHVVANAAMERLVDSFEIWRNPDVGWAGVTWRSIRRSEIVTDVWGIVDRRTLAQQPCAVSSSVVQSNQLGWHDECITLAAGVIGEAMRAIELGMDGDNIISQVLSDEGYTDFTCCRDMIQENHAYSAGDERVESTLMQVVTEAWTLINDQSLWSIVKAVVAEIPASMPNTSGVSVQFTELSPTLADGLRNLSEKHFR